VDPIINALEREFYDAKEHAPLAVRLAGAYCRSGRAIEATRVFKEHAASRRLPDITGAIFALYSKSGLIQYSPFDELITDKRITKWGLKYIGEVVRECADAPCGIHSLIHSPSIKLRDSIGIPHFSNIPYVRPECRKSAYSAEMVSILDSSMRDLDLKRRTITALDSPIIHTIGELAVLPVHRLECKRSISLRSIQDIQRELAKRNLHLGFPAKDELDTSRYLMGDVLDNLLDKSPLDISGLVSYSFRLANINTFRDLVSYDSATLASFHGITRRVVKRVESQLAHYGLYLGMDPN
jgi:hypothetical protein